MNTYEEETKGLSPIDKLGRFAIVVGLAKMIGKEELKRFVGLPKEVKKAMFLPVFMLVEEELQELSDFFGDIDREEISEALAEFLSEETLIKLFDAEEADQKENG